MASLVLVAVSCEKNEEEQIKQKTEVSAVNKEENNLCGNDADRRNLSPNTRLIQGGPSLCELQGGNAGNPGLLDCRTLHKGGHSKEGNWFLYEIFQGNKHVENATAVRIERGFVDFDRSTDDLKQMEFTGTLRVDNLPNSGGNFEEDYTYVTQMHGSGNVIYPPRELEEGETRPEGERTTDSIGLKHTTAIWLLRAERTGANTYKLNLEYSQSAKTTDEDTNANRQEFLIKRGLNIGQEYEIQIDYGYKDGRNFGTIAVDGMEKTVPDFTFTTERQYFRYGAYRAGERIEGTGNIIDANPENNAVIAWKNDVKFCNP